MTYININIFKLFLECLWLVPPSNHFLPSFLKIDFVFSFILSFSKFKQIWLCLRRYISFDSSLWFFLILLMILVHTAKTVEYLSFYFTGNHILPRWVCCILVWPYIRLLGWQKSKCFLKHSWYWTISQSPNWYNSPTVRFYASKENGLRKDIMTIWFQIDHLTVLKDR